MKRETEVHNKPLPGRPAGSGAQLPGAARTKKSRDERAASGAVRGDFSLDRDNADKLGQLMELWRCPNRKEAIQQAINIAHLYAYDEGRSKK